MPDEVKKTVSVGLKMDPDLHRKFIVAVKEDGLTMRGVLEGMIRDWLQGRKRNG